MKEVTVTLDNGRNLRTNVESENIKTIHKQLQFPFIVVNDLIIRSADILCIQIKDLKEQVPL
ncbi:hypothetical protein [Metabacillus halosaccharovorans]|uniref:hypothetical protein n=1 Tax=Metabacillus halosaccharovorans TaxID=930124 RepID=UPI00203CE583|nr:hypothetical protein [Metabacillus halosaccharovorans]MCM3444370.1 hypothetical protein [Metabacillus halosaccharovorans]